MDPEQLRRYPSPRADAFRAAAARVHGVSADMILAGNGRDEILSVALRTFLGPGDTLAYPDPTYSLYPVLAESCEIRVCTVPWEAGFELPIAALLGTGARAIFFANHNAPTGTLVRRSRVRELAIAFDGLVLVDEAYVDFADESCLELVRELPNVMICRTFSKGYALAGLRFGYAIAAPALVAMPRRESQPSARFRPSGRNGSNNMTSTAKPVRMISGRMRRMSAVCTIFIDFLHG